MMFGKIFSQIFDSSIACNPDLRHFFMDMIVLADADGDVDMTPESIAARTRIPLEQVNEHLACLCNPDPRSRTPDKDGRRLELLDDHRDWGWHIINYPKFREIASNEQRKASQRERVNRFRAKTSEACNAPVTHSNACNAMQKQKQKQKHVYNTRENFPEVNGVPKPTEKTDLLREWLCREFKRPETDFWDYQEETGLAEVSRRPAFEEEFNVLFLYRGRNGKFFPQSIKALLTKWQATLDQARNWKPAKSQKFTDTIKGPFA